MKKLSCGLVLFEAKVHWPLVNSYVCQGATKFHPKDTLVTVLQRDKKLGTNLVETIADKPYYGWISDYFLKEVESEQQETTAQEGMYRQETLFDGR